ncbi:MAG: GTPase ObgE [Alphaproteobacteria bacterium]|nr:GTPase ObgE [Alphaproteobacteria bacterium]
MRFLDQARIHLQAGHGGAGCVAFLREKFRPWGGPNGGNGGRGGNIYAVVDPNLNTLIDFRYCQHFKAPRGEHGQGKDRDGRAAKDLVIPVPPGTQVLDETNTFVLHDLVHPDQRVLLCQGGDGGLGNRSFRSSTNQAPRICGEGYDGESMSVWLRLKILADIGLIGLPNAGKSAMLRALTSAKSKVADYAFSTLYPHLGMLSMDHGSRLVLADLPGLIEGASEGRGMGTRFLGHAERCRMLIYVLDAADPDRSIAAMHKTIAVELDEYDPALRDKTALVWLNKADLLDDSERSAAIDAALDCGFAPENIHCGSALSKEGLPAFTEHLAATFVALSALSASATSSVDSSVESSPSSPIVPASTDSVRSPQSLQPTPWSPLP